MYKIILHINRLPLLFLILVLLVLFFSCSGVVYTDQPEEGNYSASQDFSYQLPADSSLQFYLAGINGNITVTGKAGYDSVKLYGTITVKSHSEEDAYEHLQKVEINIEQQSHSLDVSSLHPDNDGRTYIINYFVELPVHSSVSVFNLNGIIKMSHIEADVLVSQANGNIEITGLTGSLEASAINGNISTDMVLEENGMCQLQTVNGNLNLTIPESTSADLTAEVINGIISISGLNLMTTYSSNTQLFGVLNDGEGMINMKTINGLITISPSYN